jgi:LPXTG-site transpeptidase (sortase) family protein
MMSQRRQLSSRTLAWIEAGLWLAAGLLLLWYATGPTVAIAAHRDSVFRPLRQVRAGDLVILSAAGGSRRYQVEWTRIVDPEDVDVVGPTDYPALTLVTCYPFHDVGNAPRRFIVRARAVDDAAPAEAPPG